MFLKEHFAIFAVGVKLDHPIFTLKQESGRVFVTEIYLVFLKEHFSS
jgi:hypothetical protein